MKYTAIFATSIALLAFSSRAADIPSDTKTPSLSVATNAPTVTNAPHLHPTFTERLHQIQKREGITNRVPDRASQQALFEQQMQQIQREHDEALKRGAAALPPLPPSSAVLPLPPSQPVAPSPRYKSGT